MCEVNQSIKIVPVTGAGFSGISMDSVFFAFLFPHQLLVLCVDIT